MAQFIPTVPGIGASIGTGFSGGVSKGLDAILENKLRQMAEARQNQQTQSQQQNVAKILAYLSGAPEGEDTQQFNQPPQPSVEELVGVQPQRQLGAPTIQKNPLIESLQRGNVSREELDQLTGTKSPIAQAAPQKFSQVQAEAALQKPRQLSREKFAELLSALPPHLQAQAVAAYQGQQAKAAANEKEARKEEALSQREINKRTQPFYDKVIEGEKAAKQVKTTLRKLDQLDKKGNLPPAALYNALTSLESIGTLQGSAIGGAIGGILGAGGGAIFTGGLGTGLGLTAGSQTGAAIGAGLGAAIKPVTSLLRSALISQYPDTEEFEKTSLEFLKNVRPLIGGHVTENQLDLFIKSIPTLATTSEGRKQIINNMGVVAEGATAEYYALEEILHRNNGKRPDNLEFQVERLADKKRAEYAKRWES